MRDGYLLAQDRLSLPAASPRASGPGATRFRLDFDWGNDFGIAPSPGGQVVVDGEHRTLGLEVTRGLTPALALSARLPLHWRGGGLLDGVIDWWHRLTGLPDGGRGSVPADGFRVLGPDASWSAPPGAGLGRLEVAGHWTPAAGGAWTPALVLRAGLPTGAGAYASASGVDLGLQALVARPLGARWDLFTGVGGVAVTDRTLDGLRYAPARAHAFLALEWRPARVLSVLGEASVASRLAETPAGLPGAPAYLRLGAKLDAGAWTLEGGFVEGIHGLAGTTDFGIMLALVRRLPGPRPAP
ncbi:MAG TPA: DUF3187 family protein [Vicinamibacteria bacterium]|jgi:hypothetical protein